MSGPPSGAGAVKAEQAAGAIITVEAVKQRIELPRSDLAAGTAQFERAAHRRGELARSRVLIAPCRDRR